MTHHELLYQISVKVKAASTAIMPFDTVDLENEKGEWLFSLQRIGGLDLWNVFEKGQRRLVSTLTKLHEAAFALSPEQLSGVHGVGLYWVGR